MSETQHSTERRGNHYDEWYEGGTKGGTEDGTGW